VVLSITLTLCSTLLAVFAMPTLTWWYLGERIPVPVWGMLFTVLKIVIAPVCIGVVINHLLGKKIEPVKPLFPVISVIAKRLSSKKPGGFLLKTLTGLLRIP